MITPAKAAWVLHRNDPPKLREIPKSTYSTVTQ
jgi:hypothetical protein